MDDTIRGLEKIIQDYTPLFQPVSEEAWQYKSQPGKWSKKEILGHLIDSAQNNIRRFIVAQYEERPFIKYQQDEWVAISHYQNHDTKDLIELWVLINKHICIILKNTSPEKQQREVLTGELHSIAWLAKDYNKHLLHHLHQVLDMTPVAYP
ncbi:MAG: DinB family protein [Chitinophagaceae bacterium]|nr:DinB family protein [Chitinophagaceae bacterium]